MKLIQTNSVAQHKSFFVTLCIYSENNIDMESITIYPKSEKQKSLLKSLLEEMKVHFEMSKNDDQEFMSEQAFYEKIDKSIQQAEKGQTTKVRKEELKTFLGL
ncbi:MAG: hypothetical protein JST62_09500 [Bacteroidetes bacterium]|nr:hypothetical protein [Bacteroidota bacterium]